MYFLFSISDFAKIYGSKLGINESILKKTLWGDFYLHTKSKRIFKGAQAKAKKPLFVQFVLENLWAVYDAVLRRLVVVLLGTKQSLFLTCNPVALRLIQLPTLPSPY